MTKEEQGHLGPFQLRAVTIGVQATLMVIALGVALIVLPSTEPIDRDRLARLLAGAALGALLISRLPWRRFIEEGRAEPWFYAWSVGNIALISAAVLVTGGGRSIIYYLYALPILFFGVVFRRGAQLAFLGFTMLAYAGSVAITGWHISPAVLVVRLGLFATLAFLASFLARELKQLMERQRELATHDSLTGLPNRRLLQDRAAQAIATARRAGRSVALMLIDVDRFKEINDTLGHPYGDLLLKQIGARLAESMREADSVARLGGDEFAVLVTELSGVEGAELIAGRIKNAISAPFVVEGLSLDVEASMGIALFPDHAGDIDTLIQKADIAMYSAKEHHRQFQTYSPDHDRHSSTRLQLLNDLRSAIEDDQLVVYYQPKVDLESRRILGAEALVRWQHPRLGLVPPGSFIPLAEQSSAISRITMWVAEQVADQAAAWRAAGRPLKISLNLSVRDLQDIDLPAKVWRLMQRPNLDPTLIEFELTEGSVLADPERSMSVLTSLKKLGVSLALDDFGTGYSSLAYLRDLPVDVIKIDRGFVFGMETNARDRAIVQSTIDLARNLELEVVAEGVETEEVSRQLRLLGCRLAQGFHFSKPVPLVDFEQLLGDFELAVSAPPDGPSELVW